jgi:hypothetical protein
MNFFKRARTPEELVFKCCNAYEDLVKPMPAKQAVRVRSCTTPRSLHNGFGKMGDPVQSARSAG